MPENITKTECVRCGTCCLKGGPALHLDDKQLLQNNVLNCDMLLTVRKGEPVFTPDAAEAQPAKAEFLKIKGQNSDWACMFFDHSELSCTIYEHRPLECLLLKCWDTEDIEEIAGKQLLSRFDIIPRHDQILSYIGDHEKECLLDCLVLLSASTRISPSDLTELEELVNRDLIIRARAAVRFNISLDQELFYFGRPLFKILYPYGLLARETPDKVILIQQ